jgi:hypothetical protein
MSRSRLPRREPHGGDHRQPEREERGNSIDPTSSDAGKRIKGPLLVRQLDRLDAEIGLADEAIKAIAKDYDMASRLMSIPCIDLSPPPQSPLACGTSQAFPARASLRPISD